MKKKFVFPLILVTIIFLTTSCVNAQFFGSFLKGFADGLQKGAALKLKKQELELQKEQLKLLKEIEYLQNESNKINTFLSMDMDQDDVKNAISFDLTYEDNSQMIFKNNEDYLVVCLFFEDQLIAWDIITSTRESYLFDTLVDIAEAEKDRVAKEAKRENYYTPFKSSTLDQLKENFSGELIEENRPKEKGNILKFNPFHNSWQYANKEDVLKYNVFEKNWEYTEPESQTKYNAFEDKWEFAIPEEQIKFNAFESEWSYENKDSTIQYNPFENKWEYAKPGSSIKFNPFENTWGYE
jgi:hypothetical protein